MFYMIIFILIICIILFFILTAPYKFKLERKIKKLISFEEISEIENMEDNFSDVKNLIREEMNVETFFLESQYVDEIMKYTIVTNKNIKDTEKYPTLVLLHGLRDCSEDWLDRGKLLENYLLLLKNRKISPMNFILVDSGYDGRSWYTNMRLIPKKLYEEFIVKDLLPKLDEKFQNIVGICGFSMGGYAAYKIGIKNRERFKIIGSFSGAVSLVRMIVNRRIIRIFKFLYVPKFLFSDADKRNFIDVFGTWCYRILREDPYTLLKTVDRKNFENNYFYASVGREDFRNYLMLQQFIDMIFRMKKHKFKFKGNLCLRESHTWEYVSRDLKNFLIFFDENTK